MAEPLFASLTRLYTDGDLDGLRSRLLYGSAWCQHQFTAYGDELTSRCWMSWLSACGPSTCEEVLSVQSPGESVLLLSLRPRNGREPVRVGLWTWHNDEYLRRVFCHIDTAQLCLSLGIARDQLSERLPAPDPLLIEDYDQQSHVGCEDATPRDLLEADDGTLAVLDRWWNLWQHMQLADAATVYAADAVVRVPGTAAPVSLERHLDYCAQWFVRMRRRWCQIESIIADGADPGSVAVLWRMEGDMDGNAGPRRVRVPVVSHLKIADKSIRSDTMVIDEVTLDRQLAS